MAATRYLTDQCSSRWIHPIKLASNVATAHRSLTEWKIMKDLDLEADWKNYKGNSADPCVDFSCRSSSRSKAPATS